MKLHCNWNVSLQSSYHVIAGLEANQIVQIAEKDEDPDPRSQLISVVVDSGWNQVNFRSTRPQTISTSDHLGLNQHSPYEEYSENITVTTGVTTLSIFIKSEIFCILVMVLNV